MHVEQTRLVLDESHEDAVRALLFPDLEAWTLVLVGAAGDRSVEIVLREELEGLFPGPGAGDDQSAIHLVEDALRESGHQPSAGLHEPDAVAAWTLVPLG